MTRVMHKQDVRGPLSWPYIDMTGVEMQLEGAGPWTLAEGLKVVYTPGHSGSSSCSGQLKTIAMTHEVSWPPGLCTKS